MLSYSDTMSMKPGAKGKSNMSNKEWKKFEEECLEWFEAQRLGAYPNQTRHDCSSQCWMKRSGRGL